MSNHTIDITCPNCGHEYDAHLHWLVCPECGHETNIEELTLQQTF
jgi:Zn finger protein HypA/HybF involved in hydrogenase expression